MLSQRAASGKEVMKGGHKEDKKEDRASLSHELLLCQHYLIAITKRKSQAMTQTQTDRGHTDSLEIEHKVVL